MRRRLFLGGLGASALASAPARAVEPEELSVIVPELPTGAAGTALRVLRPYLEDALRRPVTVDFRPGAGGIVGLTAGARAAPDGSTLTVLTPALTLGPWLSQRMDCTPGDFAPLGRISFSPSFLLARPESPWPSVTALLGAGRSGTSFAVPAPWDWQPAQFAQALFIARAKLPHVSIAGAQSPENAIAMLQNGQIDFVFATLQAGRPQLPAGARVLAVAGPERVPDFRAIPTLAEAGLNLSIGTWRSLAAPAGTPSAVMEPLKAAFRDVMADPAVRAGLRAAGIVPSWAGGPDAARDLRQEYREAGSLFSALGLNVRDRPRLAWRN